MKNRSKVFIALFMVVVMLAISSCSFGQSVPTDTPEPQETEAPVVPSVEPSADPTVEPTEEPQPESTPEPTPEPTPEVTPEPTPDPARFIDIKTSETIRITKHPGGEEVAMGENAIFIAHADNDVSVEWRFVAPDASREVVWNADDLTANFPGVSCRAGNEDTFYVNSIPKEMNGWTVVALFTDKDGGMIASDGAKIMVNGAPTWTPATTTAPVEEPATTTAPVSTPAPTPTPSQPPVVQPTPTPITTPAPTMPPAPTPTPTQPPVVTPTPTPAHTHSYSSSVVAPTCTTGGYTLHTCSCGASYTDSETPALGHDWVAHTEHVQVGMVSHNFCGDCGLDLTAAGMSGGAVAAHCKEHVMNGGSGRTYSQNVPVYDDVTTYTCSRCGATQ